MRTTTFPAGMAIRDVPGTSRGRVGRRRGSCGGAGGHAGSRRVTRAAGLVLGSVIALALL